MAEALIERDMKSRVGKNILSLGLVEVANYVLPVLSVPVISRIIGPDKLGAINLLASIAGYFVLLIGYGFDYSATRQIARDPDNAENRSKVFSEVFCSQCFLFLLSVILYTVLVFSIPKVSAEQQLAVFSFLICISTLMTQNWMFQAMQDLQKVALFNFVSKLLFVVVVLLVIRHKQDYIWQPLIISVIQIGVSIISFTYAIRRYKIRLYYVPLTKCLALLWEERNLFFSLVVINVYTTTNIVILGLSQNNTQVGYYTAGQRLIYIIMSVINLPLGQALYPFIGKAFSESYQSGLQIAQKLIPLLVYFTGVIAVSLFLLGPLFIHLFYGKAFLNATPVFRILVCIPLLVSVSNVFGVQVMVNLKMDKLFFSITFLGALLSVVFNIFMVKTWGYIGTAANWALTEAFITVAMYIALRRKGINLINFNYWRFSAIAEQLQPIYHKLFSKAQSA